MILKDLETALLFGVTQKRQAATQLVEIRYPKDYVSQIDSIALVILLVF